MAEARSEREKPERAAAGEYPVVVSERLRAAYKAGRAEIGLGGASTDDQIIRRGLEFLEEAGSAAWSSADVADLVKQLGKTRAMYEAMLAEAVALRRRFRELEAQRIAALERSERLEAEFRALQGEAAACDPSLLDLRPKRES